MHMKNPKDDPKFFEILGQAWGLGPSELKALLDNTCGPDDCMRDAVLAAISADQADPDYLEDVTPILKDVILELDQDLNPPQREMRPGQQFGRYEIVELIGEGGMGAIYKGTLKLDASTEPRQLDMKFDAGPESERLMNLVLGEHSEARSDGKHRIVLEGHGYRWFRVGGLDYILKRTKY